MYASRKHLVYIMNWAITIVMLSNKCGVIDKEPFSLLICIVWRLTNDQLLQASTKKMRTVRFRDRYLLFIKKSWLFILCGGGDIHKPDIYL